MVTEFIKTLTLVPTAMKENCEEILAKLGGGDNPLLSMAKKLEEIALQDEFFIDRKLFPNVDFYSGIIS